MTQKKTTVKSYEQACKIMGRPVLTLEDFAKQGDDAQRGFSNHRLDIVNDAANKGVVFDYENIDQDKWFPYFRWVPGSGFVLLAVDYDDTRTPVGARRSFATRELAVEIVNQFIDDYRHTL